MHQAVQFFDPLDISLLFMDHIQFKEGKWKKKGCRERGVFFANRGYYAGLPSKFFGVKTGYNA